MITRSKQRAIAAQFQSDVGRKSSDEPQLEMKLPSDWTELPVELLLMIFNNLTIEPRTSKEQRKPLLNCRLVHPHWKSAVDDLLEKRCLSFWKKWKQSDINPYQFPVVYFNPAGNQNLENVTFPSFLLGEYERSPFPTNSVYLTFAETCKDNYVLIPKGDAHFFSKFGRHLTSLTIERLYGMKDFTTSTLQQLLTFTPHLKSMTLQFINIKLLEKDVGKISLPPLPHLECMRLRYVDWRGIQFNVVNWVLEPYKKQLIGLRCSQQLGCAKSPTNFPLLKQLHLHWPNPQQLLAPVAFPSLKSLELTNIELRENLRKITLQNVFKFVSRVADTLVELQLDIYKQWRSKDNLINYDKNQSLQELKETQQNRFPGLKTLTITFPRFAEEVKVIKDFLKMFPNLELLNFTQFGIDGMTLINPYGRRVTVYLKAHIKKEKYEEVCPKLRSINVCMMMENEERPFFTSRSPFTA